jgi:hypothetical protein
VNNEDINIQIINTTSELNKWKELVCEKEKNIEFLQDKIKCLQENIEEIKLKCNKLETMVRSQDKSECQVTKSADTVTNTATIQKKRSMLIIGDSHSRGLADKLRSRFSSRTVTGSVHPSAGFKEVTQDLPRLVARYNKEDTVIVVAGANDIYKNNLDRARQHLTLTLRSLHSVRVVVVGIPARHDLPPWSCVNKEIVKANRVFFKITQAFTNTSFVDINNLERRCFTNHGLHLNDHGKTVLASGITSHINNSLSVSNRFNVIPLEHKSLNCRTPLSTTIT